MRRFYLENMKSDVNAGDLLTVPEYLQHRISKVLRLKNNERVEFIDGKGLLAEAELYISGRKCSFCVKNVSEFKKPSGSKNIAVSLIRRERFDLLVEKAVELGVDNIIPVKSEYSRPYKPDAYAKLTERWQRIADQALSQCKRIFRSNICDIVELKDLDFSKWPDSLFFHPGSENFNNYNYDGNSPVLFIIGPEGGFSEAEVLFLNRNKIGSYSISDTILRTETAAFFALAKVL